MALLASTTLGVDASGTVRAEVTTDAELLEGGEYRLVVQSYDAGIGGVPGHRAKPMGSIQRAVTGAELRKGIRVSLVELRQAVAQDGRSGAGTEPVVVAWIEAGKPDLEFDGRMARPRPGSVYGLVRRTDREEQVQIRLDRKLAA